MIKTRTPSSGVETDSLGGRPRSEDNDRGATVKRTISSPNITSDASLAVLGRARERATQMDLRVTIAVVDGAATLKALLRMDGASLPSVDFSQRKAYTAVAVGRATDDFYELVRTDEPLLQSIISQGRFALVAGGIPIVVDGAIVGAIGVGGGDHPQDREIAAAGVEALR